MPLKVFFVHTVGSLMGLFSDLSKELLPPGTEIVHVADEMLLKIAMAQGGLSPFIFRRVADHCIAAEEAGATIVQVTCSSISPCVDIARHLVSIPVLKIDEPMVDYALSIGDQIGVAATAATTLKPTTELVQRKALETGKSVQVDSVLCQGAFQALMNGEMETHDGIVVRHLRELMKANDVIILAQASMARVANTIPEAERSIPILSSPRLAVQHAAQVLQSLPA